MVRFSPSVRRFFTPLNTFLAIIALVMAACVRSERIRPTYASSSDVGAEEAFRAFVPKYDKVKIRHWDDNQMIFSV